ncbi:MAG: TonB family protein [Solirubrobacterales bacterium]|jgi:TonB family protein
MSRFVPFIAAFLVLSSLASPLRAQEEPLTAGSGGVPVPKRSKTVSPEYPAEAQAQGIRGIVILELIIDKDGKVIDAKTVRSVPGLDEAALTAARQWTYEVTKVDGKPVSVRLTVPITFAMKLPDITRQEGIPELRQGVVPPFPQDAKGPATAVAAVTLDGEGRVAEAQVVEGEAPWTNALLAALRTWRFAAESTDVTLSFRVQADFIPGEKKGAGRVALRLDGVHRSESLAGNAPPAGAPGTAAAPAPAEPLPSAPAAQSAPPASAPAPTPPSATPTSAPPTSAPPPSAPPTSAPPPGAATPAPSSPAPTTTTAAPARPAAPAGSSPAPASPGPASAPPAAAAAPPGSPAQAQTPPATRTAPPPVEVISAPPPAAAAAAPTEPENGTSALRDVLLDPGVPDLARGRRPVPPPFARMSATSGSVEVQFSVSAGGTCMVQSSIGPDLLKAAAEQTVTSWQFRRTQVQRLFLTALFTFDVDKATAVVRPQTQPPPAQP